MYRRTLFSGATFFVAAVMAFSSFSSVLAQVPRFLRAQQVEPKQSPTQLESTQTQPVRPSGKGLAVPGVVFGPRPAGNPVRPLVPSNVSSGKSRGIEDSDTRRGPVIARPTRVQRVVIVHPEGTTPSDSLEKLQVTVGRLAALVNRGGKLTKADAVRMGFEDELKGQRFVESLRRAMLESGQPWITIVASGPSSGHKQIACPPPDCGCKDGEPGSISKSCDCGAWGEWCYCLLCYIPHKLSDNPSPDRLLQSADSPAPAPLITDWIIVVNPGNLSRAQWDVLLKTGLEEMNSLPQTSEVTIKQKSLRVTEAAPQVE